MTDIAILGSGAVAAGLAGGFAARGHEIVVGSRDPRGRMSAWPGPHEVALVGLAEAFIRMIRPLVGALGPVPLGLAIAR